MIRASNTVAKNLLKLQLALDQLDLFACNAGSQITISRGQFAKQYLRHALGIYQLFKQHHTQAGLNLLNDFLNKSIKGGKSIRQEWEEITNWLEKSPSCEISADYVPHQFMGFHVIELFLKSQPYDWSQFNDSMKQLFAMADSNDELAELKLYRNTFPPHSCRAPSMLVEEFARHLKESSPNTPTFQLFNILETISSALTFINKQAQFLEYLSQHAHELRMMSEQVLSAIYSIPSRSFFSSSATPPLSVFEIDFRAILDNEPLLTIKPIAGDTLNLDLQSHLGLINDLTSSISPRQSERYVDTQPMQLESLIKLIESIADTTDSAVQILDSLPDSTLRYDLGASFLSIKANLRHYKNMLEKYMLTESPRGSPIVAESPYSKPGLARPTICSPGTAEIVSPQANASTPAPTAPSAKRSLFHGPQPCFAGKGLAVRTPLTPIASVNQPTAADTAASADDNVTTLSSPTATPPHRASSWSTPSTVTPVYLAPSRHPSAASPAYPLTPYNDDSPVPLCTQPQSRRY